MSLSLSEILMGLFEFIDNKEIETRTPRDLPPLTIRKRELSRYIAQQTSDHLKSAYKFIFGKTINKPKAELISIIADFFCFSKVEQFREWLFTLPVMTQKIFCEAAFTDFVVIPHLEKKYGVSLAEKSDRYWRIEWHFIPELKLDFLPIGVSYIVI